MEIVAESGSRFTRKRLMVGAGVATGGALGAAALAPCSRSARSGTPSPCRDALAPGGAPGRPRGAHLPGAGDRAGDVLHRLPDRSRPGSDRRAGRSGAPRPGGLRLPADRAAWAPGGIVAYSKICTHAACAIALYRKPTFTPLEPRPALVCPCHYATFDPATGGAVIYDPAGRPLPQLPLVVDAAGLLRAAGNFSGPVGPSWWACVTAGPRDHRQRALRRRAHGRGRRRAQGPALRLPRSLVVPPRRGRPVRIHGPRGHGHLSRTLRSEPGQGDLPRDLRAPAGRQDERGLPVGGGHLVQVQGGCPDPPDPPLGGRRLPPGHRPARDAGALHRRLPQAARPDLARRPGHGLHRAARGLPRLFAGRRPPLGHGLGHRILGRPVDPG